MKRRKPARRTNVKNYSLTFKSENGSIEISETAFTIVGTIEGAALALAESILLLKKASIPSDSYPRRLGYQCLEAIIDNNGKITLNMTKSCVEKVTWPDLKKGVEKICNNLTAFI